MFSLRSLLDKVTSVQTEISGKLTTSPKTQRRSSPTTTNSHHDLTTGTELLNHYQHVWEGLHKASMSQATSAASAAQLIDNLHSWVQKQDVLLGQLEEGVAELPRLSETIENCTGLVRETGLNISSLLVELDKLEQICDDLHLDRMKSVHRHHLDTYREERHKELIRTKAAMEKTHIETQRARKIKENLALEERYTTFNEIFRRDLEDYKTKGSLSVREVQSAPLDTLESFVPEEDPDLSSFLGSEKSERTSSALSAQSEGTSSALSEKSERTSSALSAKSEGTSSALSAQAEGTSSALSAQSEGTSSALSAKSERTSSALSAKSEGTTSDLSEKSEGTTSALSAQSEGTSSALSADTSDQVNLKDIVIEETDSRPGSCNTDSNAEANVSNGQSDREATSSEFS